ncbi:MAG: hypothetical protein ABIM30_00350 [candidate division WOR-3 bacterium]
MGYIDDKIREIYNMLKSDGISKIASGKDTLKYFQNLNELSDKLIKIANSSDITLSDLEDFIHKKGDFSMKNKDVLIKTASILRALARYLDKEQLQKEAQAKSIIESKLRSLGVEVDKEKIEKIAKNNDVVDILSKISYDKAPSIGNAENASDAGGLTSADERFLRFLGL